ncbi:MAG: NUDIX hydrolase [Candidatus Zixiibacteriota bacterium]
MSDKHVRFDEAKLTERKKHHCGFQFCPLCGLRLKEGEVEGLVRLYCPDQTCGYVFYQNPIPAAGVMLVENDHILLVKRAHPPRIGWWCIPAGFMEWNEHPRQTAVRELEEETGLKVRLTSFFEVYSGSDDPRSNAVLMLYLGEVIGGEIAPADDAREVRWFPFDALPADIAFEAHRQALADYDHRERKRAQIKS